MNAVCISVMQRVEKKKRFLHKFTLDINYYDRIYYVNSKKIL